MRVYEFAKEAGVTSKEILDWLDQHGHNLGSHMAILPEDAFELLIAGFDKDAELKVSAPSEQEAPRSAKKPPLNFTKKKTKSRFADMIEEEPLAVHLQEMTLIELARQVRKPASELILLLLRRGIVCNLNQIISKEVVADIARNFDIPLIESSKEEKKIAEKALVSGEKKEGRPPVVVVMGHVDHGKTSLLDFIRKTRVASREKGGITQHIGAYEVKTPQGELVFLDTPGHEAFSRIRARGAKVADIAILIVAADDGIMPQTIEALHHARSMSLPIIVAVNKMDRVDPARLDIVRKQLSDQNLLPEEWGGQTIVVPISAKTGDGVDKLLEMIVLQSEIMELGADKGAQAQGYVLESKLEKGRGVVATVICQTGTVHIGDYFICGKTYGKVTSLVNCHGARVEKTGPSIPVQVAGFDGIPDVGDTFSAVSEQEFKKIKQAGGPKIQSVPRAMLDQDSIPLVLKADTHSSLEALIGSLEKISKKEEKGFQIIHSAVGDINESDILLGSNTGGMIVGFHVKTDPNAVSLAQKEGVQVRHFNIIYKLLEDLQEFLKGKEEVKMVRVKTGEGLVLKVFDIKKIGVIAGCRVQDGKFVRDGNVVVWRGKYKVGQGKITSLQRDKKTVKEVLTGFEFACIVDEFTEWQVDDRVECFIDKPAK